MAWEETLLPAAFRGIKFEVISTNDEIARSVITREYPYQNGGNTEDMGRSARPISITAVFYGDDYEIALQQFIAAIDKPGTGELIHPVFGSVNAQFVRASIPHNAAEPDQTRVSLEFIESVLGAALFDRVLPLHQVEAVDLAADAALETVQARFLADIAAAAGLPALVRDQLSADMSGVMDKMRGYCDQLIAARGWIASGVYYLNNPIAFVDDLSGGLVSRLKALFSPINLRISYGGGDSAGIVTTGFAYSGGDSSGGFITGFARRGLESVWKAPAATMQQPLLVTAPGAGAQPPQAFLAAHVEVQVAIALASCAAKLFAKGLDDAVMTPADIEIVTADARNALNGAIAQVRATFPDIVQSRPITESLKALALTVTDAAEKLISARPPLLSRVVDTPGNLQLLAHLWYGDYRRADELLRLNGQLRNPNDIRAGTTLLAYAQ